MTPPNYYLLRKLNDGRFIVFANDKDALDQETVDTYEEALKLLKVKRQQYIDFTKRQLKLKQGVFPLNCVTKQRIWTYTKN